jgi:tripartite-type tricarboxylate transporter receptor subunit TctC
MTSRRVFCFAIALLFGAGSTAVAQSSADPAQGYPSQIVRIIVPFSAGSATDILARIVADELGKRWNQQVIVENRPGIAGTTGAAKAAPDGYTLMLTSNGHTVAGVVNKNLQFDPVKDFAGITQVASVPLVLIIYPELPAKSVKEFIELAKAQPGKFNFASPGVASTTFIAGALFRHSAKIDIVHVPYKGAPESVTSVIRGDSAMYFTPANVGADLMQSGKVRALAVATPKRIPTMPDIPTLAEAGLTDFSYNSWFGLMAPAGTPRPIVEKISRDTGQALQSSEVQSRLAGQGVTVAVNAPQQFDEIIKNDTARYGQLLKEAGVGAN